MTREEAIKELKKWQGHWDVEKAGVESERIILELLAALGYSDVVVEYNKVDRWYA